MTTYDANDFDNVPLGILAERQRGIARTIGDLVKWRRDVDRDRTAYGIAIEDLTQDIKVVKNLLIGLLVTAVTGSASITIAILISTGKHP